MQYLMSGSISTVLRLRVWKQLINPPTRLFWTQFHFFFFFFFFWTQFHFFFAPPLRCHFLVSSCWKKTQEFFGVFDFRFDFYLKDIFKWYHCHLLLLTKSLPIFKKINAADRIGKKLKSVFVLSFANTLNKHQYSLKNLIAFKKFLNSVQKLRCLVKFDNLKTNKVSWPNEGLLSLFVLRYSKLRTKDSFRMCDQFI